MGTLSAEASKKKLNTLISTMDKDLAQLVSPSVTLLNTMTGDILDEVAVKEKFGVNRSDNRLSCFSWRFR